MNIQELHEVVTSEGTTDYKCSDLARKVGVMHATVTHHCKVANKNYYDNDFSKPPHPDYVEIKAYSLWVGASCKTYILPLSDHNLHFYSQDEQRKRLESRRKGKKSSLKAPRKAGERRAYVKRKGL